MEKDLATCFFLLCLVCYVTAGYEYPCVFKSSSGSFYDFSPLSKCDSNGYMVDSPTDGTFVINFCNTVKGCNSQSSICQNGQYSTGSANNYTITEAANNKGVVINYLGGDNSGGCPNNQDRRSTLTLVCDTQASPDPNITFLSEGPTCVYNFQVRSKYACPLPAVAPQIQTCPIYVHLVPHTHDDVGWLQTIDGYYTSQVQYILNTVVANLATDPTKRFIYVEQAYFWRWWNEVNTTDAQRATLRRLYDNGQFEFVLGGWVMQDEACTTYGADINQMTLGHQFLYTTFGAVPTKGWQIDPFGASSVTSTMNKLSGFDGHVIDRVTNKDYYIDNQKLQFLWQGSPSLGLQSQIFTEIMDGSTNAYCDWFFTFDFENDPVTNSNVAGWATKFYNMVNSRVDDTVSATIMAPWGCDFAFQNATAMFHSMDILIKYMQANQDSTHIFVKYSTLSEYFTAVRAATQNINWNINHGDDFLPLDEDLFWTGYFTSRTQLKGYVRQGEAVSKTAEPILTFGRLLHPKINAADMLAKLTTLRIANADAQHHDGVTGTSVPAVVLMFGNDILNGTTAAYNASSIFLNQFVTKGATSPQLLTQGSANLLNIQNGQTIAVVLFNSLGWERNDYVVIPVNSNSLGVLDSNKNKVPSQINPSYQIGSTGKFNLFFQASVPPLGYSTYFVTTDSSSLPSYTYVVDAAEDTVIANDYISVTISGTTGRISNVTNTVSGLSVQVDQNILAYVSLHSGAYAFAPAGTASPLSNAPPKTVVTNGPLVNEAYQIFQCDQTPASSFAKQNIRVYASNKNPDIGNFFELSYDIGVLPSQREIITLFTTDIFSQQSFATDDNGFEFLERQSLYVNGIEGNYYPTIYSSFIKDDISQLTVISERSHGVTSLEAGQFEVMLHRNPDMSDGFGPGLTDTTVVYPTLRVVVDTPQASKIPARKQPLLLNFPSTVFTGVASSAANWISNYQTSFQFLSQALPQNVHLLSLDALGSNTTVFRLTHLYALGEDATYSKPVTVNVGNLFNNVTIHSFVEATLTANQVIVNPAPLQVQLSPKQIRTFIIEFVV